MHLAAINGHDKLVDYLVSEGKKRNIVYPADQMNDVKLIAFAVKCDINAQDKFGDTPLVSIIVFCLTVALNLNID